MAKGSIATAWIQVLPSLEGLQSALVKASKGAVLTPAVQPKLASGTSRLFTSHGLGMSELFSSSFNKGINLQGGVKGALNDVFASFTTGGRRSANAFGDSFANLDLGRYLNTAAAIVAVASVGNAVKNVTSRRGQSPRSARSRQGDHHEGLPDRGPVLPVPRRQR